MSQYELVRVFLAALLYMFELKQMWNNVFFALCYTQSPRCVTSTALCDQDFAKRQSGQSKALWFTCIENDMQTLLLEVPDAELLEVIQMKEAQPCENLEL